jgi:hypothetical protein
MDTIISPIVFLMFSGEEGNAEAFLKVKLKIPGVRSNN